MAFYVEGPEWLYRGGRLGRDVWNLDGEIVRLTWSWKPGTTAWLVLAGEPRYPPLRQWATAFPGTPFPAAEGAVLHRLEPARRDAASAPRAKIAAMDAELAGALDDLILGRGVARGRHSPPLSREARDRGVRGSGSSRMDSGR